MTEATTQPHASRRRGQALAEFALTMPILLLLIFGIIEFARLFQTWVVLQSAARAGARAASIGGVNYDIFDVPNVANKPRDLTVLDAIVPCLVGDLRGSIIVDPVTNIQWYNGAEGFYATMYDGANCDPDSEDDLQGRRDILRIFTVIAAVREAAGTVAVYNDRVDQQYDRITPAQAFDFFKGYWNRPYKDQTNSESPGWMSVEICSTRPLLGGQPASTITSRFVTMRNASDVANGGLNPYDYPLPFCKLNEEPLRDGNGVQLVPGVLNNVHQRWFDVGGPGDRVSVFVKFNHPLITPLNLAQYIHLQSRRSSVNESFRAPKAVGAFQRSIPPGRPPEEELLPTWTPSRTPVPTNTEVPPTATERPPTETPVPFQCSGVQVIWSTSPFAGSQLFMTIQNSNLEATELTRVRLEWNTKPAYQFMYAQAFSLDGNVHWIGNPPVTPPQSLVDTRTDGAFYDGNPPGEPYAYRFITGQSIWTAVFANGPQNMATDFNLADFSAEFEFSNPSSGSPCEIELQGVTPPADPPTNTPTRNPSQSPTPICGALSNIQLQPEIFFDSFDGSVRFNLYNTGFQPVYLVGFRLVWPDPSIIRDYSKPGTAYFPSRTWYLRRVMVGGSNTSDPASVTIWQATGTEQDRTGNTRTTIPYDPGTISHGTGSEGQWLINAVLVPGDNYVFLDFDGFAGNLSQFGIGPHHFHMPTFILGYPQGCTTGQGQGQQPSATVQIAFPSPTLSPTPRATNTRAPTATRTPVTPTRTPTRTWTPLPTRTASKTSPASNTPTRTPIGFTPVQGGGGE